MFKIIYKSKKLHHRLLVKAFAKIIVIGPKIILRHCILITSSLNLISLGPSANTIAIHTAIANIPQLLDSCDCLCIGAIINFEVSDIFVITLVRVLSGESNMESYTVTLLLEFFICCYPMKITAVDNLYATWQFSC